jgi:hypothetical protein
LLCVSGLLGCWLGLCTYTRVQHTLCTLGAAVMLLVPSFRVCARPCVRYRLICNLSASFRADMPVCCLRSCVQLAYSTLDPLCCCHVLLVLRVSANMGVCVMLSLQACSLPMYLRAAHAALCAGVSVPDSRCVCVRYTPAWVPVSRVILVL